MKTIAIKEVEYEQPSEGTDGATCSTKYAWARVPAELTQDERDRQARREDPQQRCPR